MEAAIINPFLESTINLFQEMFQIPVKPGQTFLMDNFVGHRWEISGLLGITGDSRGVIAIRFHKKLVDKLLVQSNIAVANEEEREAVADAMVGEFVNIISGNSLSKLEGKHLEISPPITILGENHRIAWPKIAPVICIPFHSLAGDFEVDVCFAT